MSDDPTTTTHHDNEENGPSWTDFVLPVGLLALAVLPLTSLWDQVADPDSTRRRYGAISRFLADVGPVPVALVFGALGVFLLVAAIRSHARHARRRSAASAAARS